MAGGPATREDADPYAPTAPNAQTRERYADAGERALWGSYDAPAMKAVTT